MLLVDQSGAIAESVSDLFRFLGSLLIFFAAVAVCRWGTSAFLLKQGVRSNRWRKFYSAGNLIVLALLLLSRSPAEKAVLAVGASMGHLWPDSDLSWLTAMTLGVYYALIASSILFLAFQAVGLACRLAE